MKNIVILGAGTAGTMMANRLVKRLAADEAQVTLVDRDNQHLYQPGLLFLPFGMYREDEIVRPRTLFVDRAVRVLLAEVTGIDASKRVVTIAGQAPLPYDVLIIATGAHINPGATPGLTGQGWRETAFDFYSLEGAKALRDCLASWPRPSNQPARLVLNVVDNPIKCPVAPLEFLFLADAYFTERGVRDRVELVYATPLDGAFTKPRASALLGGLLEERKISVVPDFALEKVDGESRTLHAYDGRQERYDLLVSIPLHFGSEIIRKSGLGDELGFVPTHKHTLQSEAHPEIFVIGDATNLPASKAGAVAHFQGEVLTDNVLRYLQGRPLAEDFDGHANCFIETGYGKAMLIDFNYDTEPLPGRFPLPGVGPFSLLQESYLNHWGKLAFKWIYWNKLLLGDDLPLDHHMLMAGKWR